MIKKTIIVIAGILISAAAIFYYQVDRKLDQMEIDTDNIIMPESAEDDPLPIEPLAAADENEPDRNDFYALMIGIDQRGSTFMLNTDSLIVAHFIPDTGKIKLISIPRDQKVTDTSGNGVKINSIFASGYQAALTEARKNPKLLSGKKVSIGKLKIHEEYISSGIALLRQTLERFLSVEIDYSYLVNFETVVELVDAVGGVEIDVDRELHYTAEFDGTSIHLNKGRQLLDGRNALNYSRHRLDDRGVAYESSDFDRGRRQQEVIAALVDKIAGWNSIGKAMGLLDIVTSNIKTDMGRTKMVSLLTEYYGKLDSESIVSIPYPGKWISPFVVVEDEAFQDMLKQFRS